MSKRITASNIISAIEKLPRNRSYDYVNARTKTKVEIVRVEKPEGPVFIKRYDPSKGQGAKDAKEASISVQMIWRVANAISEGKPVNFDRVLGGSYNTRSAFETLLLHTSEFYTCMPGRIENMNSTTDIVRGHKHILWLPNEPHEIGVIRKKDTDLVVSEMSSEVVYEALELPTAYQSPEISVELSRRHAQIQVALVLIGQQLGFRTWIAQNDKGIIYKDKKIGQMNSVIPRLEDERLLSAYSDAVKAALLIDCIWFRNSHFMPAVIEIEHSTGVTSGLARMKNFADHIPPLKDVRWVITAPDEDREKVLKEANKPQFKDLNTQFLPYSAVEELFSLCQRRGLKGVKDEFLDCFMEPCLGNA
jgi:type II restriction enzyme